MLQAALWAATRAATEKFSVERLVIKPVGWSAIRDVSLSGGQLCASAWVAEGWSSAGQRQRQTPASVAVCASAALGAPAGCLPGNVIAENRQHVVTDGPAILPAR